MSECDEQNMSACEEAVAELYTYLDGELTDELRSKIRGHLDDCGHCLQAFDFEAELRNVISAKCQERVPEALRNRIAAALNDDA